MVGSERTVGVWLNSITPIETDFGRAEHEGVRRVLGGGDPVRGDVGRLHRPADVGRQEDREVADRLGDLDRRAGGGRDEQRRSRAVSAAIGMWRRQPGRAGGNRGNHRRQRRRSPRRRRGDAGAGRRRATRHDDGDQSEQDQGRCRSSPAASPHRRRPRGRQSGTSSTAISSALPERGLHPGLAAAKFECSGRRGVGPAWSTQAPLYRAHALPDAARPCGELPGVR